VIASLAWSLLPPGALRTGAFLLSSSTWILTVTVNINPLMRFDGYFLLSDWLDVPNLQERAFALGRWWLRERLFAIGAAPPERFPPRLQRILIVYALATMTYRFSLYLGIALVVYHMAFKALGLFLMCVEIGWFLVRPIVSELRTWHAHLAGQRPALASRPVATFACAAGTILMLIIPWRHHVSAPALLRAARQTTLYVAEPGRLTRKAADGMRVAQGDTVFEVDSPLLDSQQAGAQAEFEGDVARVKGQAFDPDEADMMEVGQKELEGAFASVNQVRAQQALLSVRAPFAGIVTDVPPTLHEGEWLPKREPLGMLIDPSSSQVEAYVSEADLPRVHPGAHARFFPANGDAPADLTVQSVSNVASNSLDVPELASTNGGGVAVRKDRDERMVPEVAVYRAVLVPADASVRAVRRLRGQVEIEADRVSVLGEIYRRVVAVVIRESQL
jgi:putative peptide zinc metalloprotease protein